MYRSEIFLLAIKTKRLEKKLKTSFRDKNYTLYLVTLVKFLNDFMKNV